MSNFYHFSFFYFNFLLNYCLTSNFSFNIRKEDYIRMLNEYLITHHEITPLTMAILPNYKENNVKSSHVLEESREYIVHSTPTKVIDNACKFFGSSLKGRIEGTRDISGITHKSPIAVDPSSGMYFFPLERLVSGGMATTLKTVILYVILFYYFYDIGGFKVILHLFNRFIFFVWI